MEIKHTISFKIRTYGLKGGKYQIRLRISFNGFRHDVVTGCVLLDRNAWDEKAELVKDGYVGLRGETAASMNSRLRMLRDQMKDTIKYFEANDINPDEQMLQDKFEEKISRFITPKPRPATAPAARPMSLLAVFDEFTWRCSLKTPERDIIETMNICRSRRVTWLLWMLPQGMILAKLHSPVC